MVIQRAEIRAENICPPIPTRELDWQAWLDGNEEMGTGTGPTREAAIEDLVEHLENRGHEVEGHFPNPYDEPAAPTHPGATPRGEDGLEAPASPQQRERLQRDGARLAELERQCGVYDAE